MSGAQTSSFADPNVLLRTLSGQQTADVTAQQIQNQYAPARNQLLLDQGQQGLGQNEAEMMSRASMDLLDPTRYPDEASRAAAYPGIVANLQRYGFAKNAPTEYPGLATIQNVARMGIPSADQFKLQQQIAANQALLGNNQPTTGTTPAAGGGGGDINSLPKAQFLQAVAQRESGGDPGALNYVARADPTAYARGATASGKYQMVNSTWEQAAQWAGVDTKQYPTAMSAPEAVQDQVASALYDHQGTAPWQKGGRDWVRGPGGSYALQTVQPPPAGSPPLYSPLRGGPTATVAAAGPNGGVVARNPGSVQVAGPGAPVPPPGSTAPAAAAPAASTGVMSPGELPGATIPQPAVNQMTPGAVNGAPVPPTQAPPAPTAQPGSSVQPPAPPVVRPPAAVPLPPAPPPMDNRYLTQQDYADLRNLGRVATTEQVAAEMDRRAQANVQRANTYQAALEKQRADDLAAQNLTLTGANTTLEYWKAANPDLKVSQTGDELIAQDPRTGAIVSRTPITPNMRPETLAMNDIATLGPKVANGTATPAEQARYATAADTWRQSTVKEDPITHGLIRVNQRELPQGFPEPTGIGGTPPAASTPGGATIVTPGMSTAQQSSEKQLGEDFATKDTHAYAGANASLYSLGQMNNAAEVLDKTPGSWTSTGPTANIRMNLAQGVNTIGSLFGLPPAVDPAAIGSWEALNKQTKLMGFTIINSKFGAQREAASIINNATSAVPGSENTYLGFRLVSSGIEQELQRQRELFEYKSQLVNHGQPLATAEVDFNKTHPVDVYSNRAIANAVPDDISSYLVAHPDTVKAFDGHFGSGIGEFIIHGGRTGMGAEAARRPQ